jgi:hypothetical protein
MPKPRGSEHTTLTETAAEVVVVLRRVPGVKMIAPGIINTNSRKGAGNRFITIVYTSAGFELIITGQGVQKVSIHAEKSDVPSLIHTLKTNKKLNNFTFKERERRPGV